MSLADRWPLEGHTDLRDELLAAWDRPGYHDLLHLTEVLDRLDLLADGGADGGAGFDRPVVDLAAWFHDAVYAGADDDEEQSARWAERALPESYASEGSWGTSFGSSCQGGRLLSSFSWSILNCAICSWVCINWMLFPCVPLALRSESIEMALDLMLL